AQLGRRVADGKGVKEEIGLLKQSVDVLENGVKNSTGSSLKLLEEKLEGMRAFYDFYSKDRSSLPGVAPAPDPGVTPLKILRKQPALYTDNARQARAQGTVKLAVLFGVNGKVQHFLKLNGIGYGLDEQAIIAARQLSFEPQMKDGKPVSVVKIIEYNFTLY
ncbi:MAG: energy transducer TonB, partial [Saprospiraceae bacterium]|nr:energy transducer TonB [Pyrinomonadaceae bacterium]